MNVIRWAETRSHALTIWDTGLLKTFCILFGMILGAYYSSWVMTHLWWVAAGTLILGGAYAVRWFTAESGDRGSRSHPRLRGA
jgi:hypothetical protein